MNDICYIESCPGVGKFTCTCDRRINICQEHIATHIQGPQYHDIRALSPRSNLINQRASEALVSLNGLNTKALSKGKEMLRELCDTLCKIMDDLSQRQKSLVEISSKSYSSDVEEKIKELETVNIRISFFSSKVLNYIK